ncbi:MAG: ABC transporter ATP-binding protein, partial [Clostridia bacterium]|nr:ABC transporter ATP-binding protein [Clostridia bacterium]
HLYEELEKIADRVVLIDKGRIVDVVNMQEITHRQTSEYKIEFNKREDYENFKTLKYDIIRDQKEYYQITLSIEKKKLNNLFKDLKQYDIKFISEEKYTLEKYFNQKFSKENTK